jgi:hypothetical protein
MRTLFSHIFSHCATRMMIHLQFRKTIARQFALMLRAKVRSKFNKVGKPIQEAVFAIVEFCDIRLKD